MKKNQFILSARFYLLISIRQTRTEKCYGYINKQGMEYAGNERQNIF